MTAPGQVGIIGAGLIGRGWATVFAAAGADVRVWDADPAAAGAALGAVQAALQDMADAGMHRRETAGPVSAAPTLADAVDAAQWVQESVPEQVALKQSVFAALDAAAPADTILASSTSAIPGSAFLSALPGRGRCIVAHPANPPHLLPVVELAPSPWHTPAFIARCRAVLSAVGQVPVTIRAEIPGFVMNRLQAAVIGEAMSLVARGVVAPDDLDEVMKHSLGLRWSFMGPFETMDLNAPDGFAGYAARYGRSYAALAADLDVAGVWQETATQMVENERRARVPADRVADRQRWRDRRLMALLQHRRLADVEFGS